MFARPFVPSDEHAHGASGRVNQDKREQGWQQILHSFMLSRKPFTSLRVWDAILTIEWRLRDNQVTLTQNGS